MSAVLVIVNGGFREEITVQQDFETAIDKIFPLQQPSSALEGRSTALWTLEDGRQAMIPCGMVVRVEESAE